jgi:hypothetical protein
MRETEYWAVMDRDGNTYLFDDAPICKGGLWYPQDLTKKYYYVAPRLLPKLTLDNSPQKVKITLLYD